MRISEEMLDVMAEKILKEIEKFDDVAQQDCKNFAKWLKERRKDG